MLAGNICNRDILAAMETDDKIVNIDKNYTDPQLCAAFACDIYKHLRASEVCLFVLTLNTSRHGTCSKFSFSSLVKKKKTFFFFGYTISSCDLFNSLDF